MQLTRSFFLSFVPSMKVLDAKGLTLSMIYPVSDAITYNMIKYGIYDRNCSEGNVTLDQWFEPTLVEPSVGYTPGEGTSIQLLNITIKADPSSFDNAPPEIASQWSTDENGESGGTIQFCLSTYIHTVGDPDAIVTGSETMITVTYDLTNGFSVETSVDPTRQEQNAVENFGPEGFFCDDAGVELTESQKQFLGRAGGELSVCVIPNERARNAGLGLKSIDNFSWIRVDANGGRVEQVAIEDGKVPGNGLTELQCDDDGCGFKSILTANFFRQNLLPPAEMPSSALSSAPDEMITNGFGVITSPAYPGKCLDIGLDNSNMSMSDCDYLTTQQWDYEPSTGRILSLRSDYCIQERFQYIQGNVCENVQDFWWTLTYAGPGQVWLSQERDGLFGLCATVLPPSSGYDVKLMPCASSNDQRFNYPSGWMLERRDLLEEERDKDKNDDFYLERRSGDAAVPAASGDRDPAFQDAIDKFVESVMKQRQLRGHRKLGTATISGVGTATVKFKRRIYRRNLQTGEETWEETYDESRRRFLQVVAELGEEGVTGPFGVQLDILTGPDAFTNFFDDSSSQSTFGRGTVVGAALATILLSTML